MSLGRSGRYKIEVAEIEALEWLEIVGNLAGFCTRIGMTGLPFSRACCCSTRQTSET